MGACADWVTEEWNFRRKISALNFSPPSHTTTAVAPHTFERFHHDQLNPIMNGAININIYFSSSPVSAPTGRHFQAGANLPLEPRRENRESYQFYGRFLSFSRHTNRYQQRVNPSHAGQLCGICRFWANTRRRFIFNSALFFAHESEDGLKNHYNCCSTPYGGANTPNECVEYGKQSLHPRAEMGSERRCRWKHFCELSPWWMAARAEK